MAKIVAVTACPTGIAHTIMAAEGLEQGAKALRAIKSRSKPKARSGRETPCPTTSSPPPMW